MNKISLSIEERTALSAYALTPPNKEKTLQLIRAAMPHSAADGAMFLKDLAAKLQDMTDDAFAKLDLTHIL